MKIVSSFYKYVKLGNPADVQRGLSDLCDSLGLKGRILLGHEGINGSVFGTEEEVGKFKQKLLENPSFTGIDFKEQASERPAFRKLIIRLRKEVVHFGADVDLGNTARFVTPRELKVMLDNNEEIILLDMRNDYESRVGKFRNAKTISMRNFRELPKFLSGLADLKEKRIVTYCTGGIRCEKASAFLKENGFKDVMQLKGGILAYGREFPDTYWEGKCFVFDDRLMIGINKDKDEPLTGCEWCGAKADNYTNCHNRDCDRLFACCENCVKMHKASCSSECETSPRRRNKGMIVAYKGDLRLI